MRKYKKNRFLVWVFAFIGFTIGCGISPTAIKVSQYIGLSLYNRDGLDNLTEYYLGENDWTNIL